MQSRLRTLPEIIEDRMGSGEPFTYGMLCALTVDAKDQGRTADKLVQKWRRKGWIEMKGRHGRAPLWHLTSARAALAKEGK